MSVNVDPAELEKFSQLAHRWWDPHGEFRPLHEINPLRLDWIDERAALAGKNVLDVGCGGGILAEAMAARGARVSGIDLSEKSLRVAQLHLLQSKADVQYECASPEEYAERHPAAFDVITCMELLEHVPQPANVVAACARLHDQPQPQGLSLRGHRRGVHPAAAATRHARLPALHQARGALALRSRRRAALRRAHRHDLQPAHARVSARARLRRQLSPALRA